MEKGKAERKTENPRGECGKKNVADGVRETYASPLIGEQPDDVRTYIVEGLLRLMRKRPYETVKVTDIVREAGVSRMTYYRHFKAKSDVLESLIDYIIRRVNPACHEDRRNGDWRRFWLTMFSYAQKYVSALETIVAAGQENIILQCLNRSVFPHLRKDESSETAYRLYFLSGAMYNIFFEWIKKKEGRETPEQMADICASFMQGLVSGDNG